MASKIYDLVGCEGNTNYINTFIGKKIVIVIPGESNLEALFFSHETSPLI
jgi:hypothetical protein